MVKGMNGFFLGIEVGGTYVRTGVPKDGYAHNMLCKKARLKKTGNVLSEININIIEPIKKIIDTNKEQILLGIGVSMAANVDRESGIIKSWPNHSLWNGFPILCYLKNEFPVPIIIEDDANCGVLGEYSLLDQERIKNLIYICIGTGIGCGLLLNGTLYTGENGFAGELGHISLPSDHTRCACGNEGCLQNIISGPAILKKYNSITKQDNQGIELFAGKFDSTMRRCYKDTISILSKVIYNTCVLLDVQNCILGGGVVEMRDSFIPDVISSLSGYNRNLQIKKAGLGEKSGIMGAIQLVRQQIIVNN